MLDAQYCQGKLPRYCCEEPQQESGSPSLGLLRNFALFANRWDKLALAEQAAECK
jgi:hypothetical protein